MKRKKDSGGCLRFFLFVVVFLLVSLCLCGVIIFTMGNYGKTFSFSDFFSDIMVYTEQNVSSDDTSSIAVSSQGTSSIQEVSSLAVSSLEEGTPLKAISAKNESYSVEANLSVQILVTYSPKYATDKELDWSVDDKTVAEVDSEGNVKGKFPGKCNVTASAKSNPEVKFTVPVTVVRTGAYPSQATYLLRVYKGSQSVVAYAKDAYGEYTIETKVFTCSTGAKGTPTRSGTYSTINKYRWRLMMGPTYGQYATSFSSGYLFHSVPCSQQKNNTMSMGGYKRLGTPASHGCIRLCVADAKWIYDNCELRTPVEVVDDVGPYGPAPVALNWNYPGWDPTDPDPANPYNKSR